MQRTGLRALIILAFSVCLLALGCSSATDTPPTDGDADGDVEHDADESTGRCDNGEVGCSGTVAIVCENGEWANLKDCADLDNICEKGLCVEAPVDGDLDSDQDSEPDVEREPPPDTTPPQIASTSPANGAVGVDPQVGKIRINFDEPINTQTRNFVLARDVVVYGACEKVVYTGSVTNDRLQIELSILGTLVSGERYTVTIAPDTLTDAAGNIFEGYAFSFTISGELDGDCEVDTGELPYIESSYPYDGQEGVALDTQYIQIFFSESLRKVGYDDATSIHITGSDSHTVPFSAEWLQNNTNLSLTLNETLHANTDYTVSLDEGLLDNDDNPLGAVSFGFSTRPPTVDGDEDATDGDIDEQDQSDGDIDTPPNTGTLVDANKGFCLNDPDGDDDSTNPAAYLETAWLASSAGEMAAKLRIYHRNAAYDANLQSISAVLAQDGHSLVLHETAQISTPAGYTCLRDTRHDIDYLVPTTYTVTFWPDGAESPLILTVDAPEAQRR